MVMRSQAITVVSVGVMPHSIRPLVPQGFWNVGPPASPARRVRSRFGVRTGHWLTLRQALLRAPGITTTNPPRVRAIVATCSAVRCAGARFAHRWALFGRIHAGGDGRRTARDYAGAVGAVTGRFASENLRRRFGMSAVRTGDAQRAAGAGTGGRHHAARSASHSPGGPDA